LYSIFATHIGYICAYVYIYIIYIYIYLFILYSRSITVLLAGENVPMAGGTSLEADRTILVAGGVIPQVEELSLFGGNCSFNGRTVLEKGTAVLITVNAVQLYRFSVQRLYFSTPTYSMYILRPW
jgi:hypothetical protein